MRRHVLWLGVGLLVWGLTGCGGKPTPKPVKATKSMVAPDGIAWTWYSDYERVGRLYPTQQRIWATAQGALISWDRMSGDFRRESVGRIPVSRAMALTVDAKGTPYIGLPSGLAWRTENGWTSSNAGPLASGVLALAPRARGGVWVGMPAALGWFEHGQVHIISERYRVRSFASSVDGRLWVATDGHGVLEVEAARIVEYTAQQGLCGNRIRSIAVHSSGTLAATCSDAPNRVSYWHQGKWFTFNLVGLGAPTLNAMPQANGMLIQTDKGWWALGPGPSAPGARVEPFSTAGSVAPPPPGVSKPAVTPGPAAKPPAQPAPPTATPAAAPKRPPTSPPGPAASLGMPMLVTPLASPPQAVVQAQFRPPPPMVLNDQRPIARGANSVVGAPAQAPRWGMAPTKMPQPKGQISAWTVGNDGTWWFAVANRGLIAKSGKAERRYTALSLVPREGARLSLDRDGDPILAQGDRSVLRFKKDQWQRWPIFETAKGPVLAVSVDRLGGTWALVGLAPPKLADGATPVADAPGTLIQVMKSETGEVFTEIARPPIRDLGGAARLGRLQISPGGDLAAPIYWLAADGKPRGVGMLKLMAGSRLELWEGGYPSDDPQAPPTLPDSWVSGMDQAPDGTLFLATNAGLVRLEGRKMRVFG